MALAPHLITRAEIESAIRNVYIRQLVEIAGSPAGIPNRMKIPWNPAQFRRLAVYAALPYPATALVAAPAPTGAWADYTQLDYQNVAAQGSAKDKIRMALFQCELRVAHEISLLFEAIFNGPFEFYKGRQIYKIPNSNQLIEHFLLPIFYNIEGMSITVNTPGGGAPDDIIVAAAILPHMLATGLLATIPSFKLTMFKSTLGLTPDQLQSLERYDTKITQLNDALI